MRTRMKRNVIWLALVLVLATCPALATAASTYYIYDEAGHVIGEYDASGNPVAQHIYLNDRPVAVVQNGQLDYVATDQQGTPRVVTDAQQNVVWTWSSDPSGNGQPTGSLTYNLRFPGQYYDGETGSHYNYNRDYHPATGRYMESDPIGLMGGIDSYTYARDNFLRFADPLGLCPQTPEPTPAPAAPTPPVTTPTGPVPTGNCILNALRARYGDTAAQTIQFLTLTNLLPSFGDYQGSDEALKDDAREAANDGIPAATEVGGALMQNPTVMTGGAATGEAVQAGGELAGNIVSVILIPLSAFATAAHDYAVGECAGAW